MRVLVTGSNGLVGKAIIPTLSIGHAVVNYDIGDDLDEIEACDVIIHLAAKAHAGHQEIAPRADEAALTTTVIAKAEEWGCRKIILASSLECEASLSPHFSNKSSYYKASKLYAEELCRAYALKNGAQAIILRLGIYNPSWPHDPKSPYNPFRMDEAMLCHWFGMAMDANEADVTWLTLGPGTFGEEQ